MHLSLTVSIVTLSFRLLLIDFVTIFDLAINGWAVCQKGQWVVQNPLKKCFCDLCDPADAQKQLRKKQKSGRHPDYGADFSNPQLGWWAGGNEDFSSHTHQQIIIGSCGESCIYQPIGYQQGKGQVQSDFASLITVLAAI